MKTAFFGATDARVHARYVMALASAGAARRADSDEAWELATGGPRWDEAATHFTVCVRARARACAAIAMATPWLTYARAQDMRTGARQGLLT
jgi:hypothetical protein